MTFLHLVLIGRPNLLGSLELGVNQDIKSRVTDSVITKRLIPDAMRESYAEWLDRVTTERRLLALLNPYPAALMPAKQVGPKVNSDAVRQASTVGVTLQGSGTMRSLRNQSGKHRTSSARECGYRRGSQPISASYHVAFELGGSSS
ncbi:MAG: SOS response-associated peptidase [Planctomycetes bacterium]|nr:SOS response-associated peptidase [Planctomycetota bacterium]